MLMLIIDKMAAQLLKASGAVEPKLHVSISTQHIRK